MRWALVSPDGVAPSRIVGVSASVKLPLHHKVQKFSFGTGSPRWSRKKGRKTVVVLLRDVPIVLCFVVSVCTTTTSITIMCKFCVRQMIGGYEKVPYRHVGI